MEFLAELLTIGVFLTPLGRPLGMTPLRGYRWWSSGPSAKLNNRTTKLDKLTAEVREETIPWIKHLFAGADEDESGELDAEEFRKFYPNLVEYLEENTGQVMSSVEDCMAEIDAESTAGKGNGTIE